MAIGYTYITEIKTTRKTLFYCGKKTSTKFNPGYFGSGKVVKLLKLTQKAVLSVTLHEWHDTLEAMNEAERRLIAEFRDRHGKLCVNVNHGGDGFSPETAARIQNTPSMRQKRDAARKKYWDNPAARKNAAARSKAFIEKHPQRKEALIKATNSPVARENSRKATAAKWKEPQHRERMRCVLTSEDRCTAVSEGQKMAWENPAIRAKRSAAIAAKHKDTEFLDRRKKAIQEANQKPAVKAKRKIVALKLWSDPAYKARRVAQLKQVMNTPEAIAKRSAAIKAAWARRKGQST